MKEALGSSETSLLTRATWRNIPEDAILHSCYLFMFTILGKHISQGFLFKITALYGGSPEMYVTPMMVHKGLEIPLHSPPTISV
jgi:hypothetical protein